MRYDFLCPFHDFSYHIYFCIYVSVFPAGFGLFYFISTRFWSPYTYFGHLFVFLG